MTHLKKMKKIFVIWMAVVMVVTSVAHPMFAQASADVSEYVKQLIMYYKNHQENAQTDIERVLSEMKQVDAEMAETWTKIMDYWSHANTDMTVNVGTVSSDLPEDNSMAIVILGFKLNNDGTMTEELIGRLQTGLNIAEAYPNSYVVVTGGGTASGNPGVTEGGLMGEWLLEQGLSEERLIVEDQAPDTVGNAKNTYLILKDQYPQVDSLVLVTSDYHVPRGCILFYSKCLLAAQETGGEPLDVISNAGYETGRAGYESISLQASGVASVAGVSTSGVNVTLSNLTSLKVKQNTMFQTGNELDITVEASYDSGYKRDVTELATVTGFDPSQSAEQEIVVSYSENDISYQVTFQLTEAEAEASEKDLLRTLISEAENFSGDSYTKKSFQVLTEAISEAKTVIEDETATKEEIEAVYAVLESAIAGLHTKVNIACGAGVTANCNQANAAKITDGTISATNYWQSVDGSTNVASADAEFVIDLYGTYDVESVCVYPYYRSGQQRNYQYELFGSTDNETWFPIGKNDSEEYVTADGITHEMDVRISYVKLKGISTTYVGRPDVTNIHISEVKVYGEEIDNIALYKPVISSGSDQSAASSSSAVEAKINDGDRATYWDGGLYANKPWVIIDLEDIYALDKINVVTYWQRTRYYQYEIYTSIDGVEYTKVAEKNTTNNETGAGEDFFFEDKIPAAYIKLIGTFDSGNTSFHLNELRAYGTKIDADYTAVDAAIARANALEKTHYENFEAVDAAIAAVVRGKNLKDQAVVDGYATAIEAAIEALVEKIEGINIAHGMTVTSNCNQANAYKITNGSTGDYWESINSGTNVPASEAEFVIDLDGTYQVHGVRVYPYWGGQRIYKYKLYGSTDNENWFELGENLSEKYATSAGFVHRTDAELSYVKLVGVETKVVGRNDINNIHIKELQVFGTEPTNIAYEKPVTLVNGSGNVTSITDGDRATYWDGGKYSEKPEAVIDLGKIYELDSIKVVNYWGSRHYHYEIYTSVDGEVYTKAAEKKTNENATSNGDTYTFERAIPAAYIKIVGIYNSANSAFHVNELKAYGTEFVSANKEALADAIHTATEYDEAIYTEDSWAVLEDALQEAQIVNDNLAAYQEEVDAAVKAITDAIAALELKDADYSAVDAAKAAVEALVREHYVDLTAVDAAVAAVAEGKKITEQAEVDAMAAAITEAITALVLKDADYSVVDEAKAAAEELVREHYVDLTAVDAAVAAVVEGKKITEQAEVDAMAAAITEAITALVMKDADYSAVEEALGTVPEDLSVYTEETAAVVNGAVAGVISGLDITRQDDVDDMAAAIVAAVNGLVYKPADYSAVEAALGTVPEDLSIYTEETAAVVNGAVADVIRGLDITRQDDVDDMAAAIVEAVSGLVYKPADYSAVEEALGTVPEDLSVYTEETVKALNAAVAAVAEGKNITEQAEVDEMAAAITEAITALELKEADYLALEEILAAVPADLTGYTEESKEALKEALEAVVEGLDITKQDQVDAWAAAIKAAVEGLEKVPAETPDKNESPVTGDGAMTMIYIMTMAACAVIVMMKRKRA